MKPGPLIFIFACVLTGAARATTPWEEYLSRPSAQAAKAVQDRSSTALSDGADLQLLALQVYAGDEQALRLTFRLASKSDGGDLEDLHAIAAHSIRAHPRMFLRAAVASKLGVETMKSIVRMPGLEYVDRPEAQKYELSQRLRALAGVQDQELLAARNSCLKALRDDGI